MIPVSGFPQTGRCVGFYRYRALLSSLTDDPHHRGLEVQGSRHPALPGVETQTHAFEWHQRVHHLQTSAHPGSTIEIESSWDLVVRIFDGESDRVAIPVLGYSDLAIGEVSALQMFDEPHAPVRLFDAGRGPDVLLSDGGDW